MRIISGKFKNRLLIAPKGKDTRPTSTMLRESLFNICQSLIEDAHFLDLFAGSGSMGIEAMSRGAKSVTFIENSYEAIKCIQTNLHALQIQSHCTVIQGDVYQKLRQLIKKEQQFDLIYVDPPYHKVQNSLKNFSIKPIILSIEALKLIDQLKLVQKGGMVFIEEAKQTEELPSIPLNNLKLINSRRMGSSILYQFSAFYPS